MTSTLDHGSFANPPRIRVRTTGARVPSGSLDCSQAPGTTHQISSPPGTTRQYHPTKDFERGAINAEAAQALR